MVALDGVELFDFAVDEAVLRRVSRAGHRAMRRRGLLGGRFRRLSARRSSAGPSRRQSTTRVKAMTPGRSRPRPSRAVARTDRASGFRSASRRACHATCRSSRRPARWAGRRSPRRSSPTTRTSTRPRSAATSRASGSSASAAWATTSTRCVEQIRKILRTAGQHNIALFGAGHLGQAIASSDIFADHGFRVVAIFDADPAKSSASASARRSSAPATSCRRSSSDQDIVVGVLAVPTAGRPAAGRRARRARA